MTDDTYQALMKRLDALVGQSGEGLVMTEETYQALLKRLDTLPSWSTMASELAQLRQDVARLTARVGALEAECEALRQRELARLWGEL
jgi:hypothetical protein